jgi:WD40 repeat protein
MRHNMEMPTPEALLDIEWLTGTHAAQGFKTLLEHLRHGAEVYDGPVTAIAEALSRRPVLPPKWADTIDLRNALAHGLLSGSWTSDPDGPRAHGSLSIPNCGLWMLPPEKRAERLAQSSDPMCEPPLPDLSRLRLIEPLDRVWVGHTEGIWGCEVSRDGKSMVSASRDGDLAVWDMERGTLVARASTGQSEVRDCAISSDGQRLVSVHGSGRITIWDLHTMRVLLTFDAPIRFPPPDYDFQNLKDVVHTSSRARRVALSADGSRLAVAGLDIVDVWDLRRLERVISLSVPVKGNVSPGILALFFSSDGAVALVGRHYDDAVHLVTWNVVSHQMTDRRILTMPGAPHMTRVMVTPDTRHLVAVSGSETIVARLDGSERSTSVPHGSYGQALAVSADGRMAATCSDGEPVEGLVEPVLRVWSLPNLREIWRCNLWALGCRDIACAVAFTPDGRRLILAGWEGVLRRIVLPNL